MPVPVGKILKELVYLTGGKGKKDAYKILDKITQGEKKYGGEALKDIIEEGPKGRVTRGGMGTELLRQSTGDLNEVKKDDLVNALRVVMKTPKGSFKDLEEFGIGRKGSSYPEYDVLKVPFKEGKAVGGSTWQSYKGIKPKIQMDALIDKFDPSNPAVSGGMAETLAHELGHNTVDRLIRKATNIKDNPANTVFTPNENENLADYLGNYITKKAGAEPFRTYGYDKSTYDQIANSPLARTKNPLRRVVEIIRLMAGDKK